MKQDAGYHILNNAYQLTIETCYLVILIQDCKCNIYFVTSARVFGLDIEGRDCGDEVACWLTTFLNSQPYRLVHFETQMTPRKCNEIKSPFRTTDKVWQIFFIVTIILLIHLKTNYCQMFTTELGGCSWIS